MYRTVLYCSVLYCAVLYGTVLYCAVLYYTVLCCKCNVTNEVLPLLVEVRAPGPMPHPPPSVIDPLFISTTK